jgi:hypothetical protein
MVDFLISLLVQQESKFDPTPTVFLPGFRCLRRSGAASVVLIPLWTLSVYFVLAYVGLIVLGMGGEWMRCRKPFSLKGAVTGWNVALAIFSIRGCFTVLPEFWKILSGPQPFHNSVCKSL